MGELIDEKSGLALRLLLLNHNWELLDRLPMGSLA
jgi:hypothetical protein